MTAAATKQQSAIPHSRSNLNVRQSRSVAQEPPSLPFDPEELTRRLKIAQQEDAAAKARRRKSASEHLNHAGTQKSTQPPPIPANCLTRSLDFHKQQEGDFEARKHRRRTLPTNERTVPANAERGPTVSPSSPVDAAELTKRLVAVRREKSTKPLGNKPSTKSLTSQSSHTHLHDEEATKSAPAKTKTKKPQPVTLDYVPTHAASSHARVTDVVDKDNVHVLSRPVVVKYSNGVTRNKNATANVHPLQFWGEMRCSNEYNEALANRNQFQRTQAMRGAAAAEARKSEDSVRRSTSIARNSRDSRRKATPFGQFLEDGCSDGETLSRSLPVYTVRCYNDRNDWSEADECDDPKARRGAINFSLVRKLSLKKPVHTEPEQEQPRRVSLEAMRWREKAKRHTIAAEQRTSTEQMTEADNRRPGMHRASTESTEQDFKQLLREQTQKPAETELSLGANGNRRSKPDLRSIGSGRSSSFRSAESYSGDKRNGQSGAATLRRQRSQLGHRKGVPSTVPEIPIDVPRPHSRKRSTVPDLRKARSSARQEQMQEETEANIERPLNARYRRRNTAPVPQIRHLEKPGVLQKQRPKVKVTDPRVVVEKETKRWKRPSLVCF